MARFGPVYGLYNGVCVCVCLIVQDKKWEDSKNLCYNVDDAKLHLCDWLQSYNQTYSLGFQKQQK